MRILITIPHYFDPAGDGRYGSTQQNPQPRIAALTYCLRNLRTLYANPQEVWRRDGDRLRPAPANAGQSMEMDIVICTLCDRHLLDQVAMPPASFSQRGVECDPIHLGFECHQVLGEGLGRYDLYGYMEDDLLLHDPAFFTKICWLHGVIGEEMGEKIVVQPNRFERYISPTQLKKVYIDFEFSAPSARPQSSFTVEQCGHAIELHTTSNPHAGCFFLSQQQMRHWAAQPHFGQPDASFVGPLESAATLGLIRTFQVLKTAPAHASFLEIEHFGQQWSRRLAAVRLGRQ